MARVNVEGRALAEGRFHNLMSDLGIDRAHAIGILVCFWHDTQSKVMVTGKRIEMVGLISAPREKREKIFQALVDNDYVSEVSKDKFRIKGNKTQVSWLTTQRNKARLGGLASGKARRQRLSDEANAKQNEAPGSESNYDPIRSDPNRSDPKKKHIRDPVGSLPPVILIWNENRGTLPECKGANKRRLNAARQRWAEKPDENYWIDIVKKISKSPFCCGDGARGWRASVDFLLKPETHLKVSEGAYGTTKGNTVKRELTFEEEA